MPLAACPPWPPRAHNNASAGLVLVVPYGGVNQQLVQIADALVLGRVLGATILEPELLVHHWWNDSFRFDELLDAPHWHRAAARVGVRTTRPSQLRGADLQWYVKCGKRGRLPDPGQVQPECLPYQVNLIRGGTLSEARAAIAPKLAQYGHVTVTSLRRMHAEWDVCADVPMPHRAPGATAPLSAAELSALQARRKVTLGATACAAQRLLFLYARFHAIQEHASLRVLVQRALAKLPQRYVAVHLRQELDILAISGCIPPSDPRFDAAERVIARWGGWKASPLNGARANMRRFHNSTVAMRKAGKCGVDASAVAEVFRGMGLPKGHAVYVCGMNDGLEPLQARFTVWTQQHVFSEAEARLYSTHASFRALLDAAISTAASFYVAAGGNFDRAVTSRRALASRPTLDSHDAYFKSLRSKRGFGAMTKRVTESPAASACAAIDATNKRANSKLATADGPPAAPSSLQLTPGVSAVVKPEVPSSQLTPPVTTIVKPKVRTGAYRYTLHEVVGEGGYGTVWRGIDSVSESDVAVKVIDVRDHACGGASDARRELDIHKSLGTTCSMLLPLLDCVIERQRTILVYPFVDDAKPLGRFVSEAPPDALTEYVDDTRGGGGDPVIKRVNPWARRVAAQLLEAASFCHSRGIAHCDIKPENVLICNASADVAAAALARLQPPPPPSLKLIDFGSASRMDAAGFAIEHEYSGPDQDYTPPERLISWQQGARFLGEPADVYSIGATLFYMLLGEPPCHGASRDEALSDLRAGIDHVLAGSSDPDAADALSDEAKELLGAALSVDEPRTRPSASSLLEYAWFDELELIETDDDDDDEEAPPEESSG